MSNREVCITVRVTMIRDGTHGVSISAPDKVLGEWQDSNAAMLKLTESSSVSICGENGEHRYMLSIPGSVIRAEMLSQTEAAIVTRM